MTPDKPKGLGAALGMGKDDEGDEGDEYASGKSAAAEAVMAALESGDTSAFAAALSDFVSMCR